MADKNTDTRSPEEIATAQKTLVKMLSIATGIPMVFLVAMANSMLGKIEGLDAAEQGFAQFMAAWGFLAPVVWAGCNGFTWMQIKKGNMGAGAYLPLIPAFWAIFFFAALYTR